ncbi:MAG TPA: 2-dehydropantoate 2-reductase [Rectinemataceae bacterium]|nr:2-dehydropantoate 2-reductase [Rectinemataceae bacterium]
MKTCIVGIGAIGGTIGYCLSKTGCELSGIARGATLAALRERGLRFTDGGPVESIPINAREDPGDLGKQDLVVLAVKAPALAQAVSHIAPLLGPDTMVLPAMNGVPWWFFQGFGGKLKGRTLASIDPEGVIASAVPAKSVIGCVVHFGASCPEPGLVKALPKRTLIIGEPSGAMTERLHALGSLLEKAGFETRPTDSIQREIWYKLWGNMTMNPISALTGATMDRILDDPLVNRLCREVMTEAKRIGAKIGCPIEQSVDDRLVITRKLGAFKTSMLQDIEARRPIELDSLLGSVAEIGALVGEQTPNIDILLGLVRLQARTLGLYPMDRSS